MGLLVIAIIFPAKSIIADSATNFAEETSAPKSITTTLKPNEASITYENSKKYLHEEVGLIPTNPFESFLKANNYIANQKYDEAIAECNKVILGCDYTPAYYLRGYAFLVKKDYDKAIADFTEYGRVLTNSGIYFSRGEAYMGKNEIGKAVDDFSESLKLDSHNGEAFGMRGNCFLLASDFDKAIADLTQAIKFGQSNAYIYSQRAAAYSSQGNHNGAIADLTTAIQIDPTNAYGYAIRGLLYSQRGDYKSGLSDCYRAVQLATNYDVGLNNLAWLLATAPDARQRDGQKALGYAKRACELTNWKNAYCLGTLAAAYAETGDFEEAIKWEKKCILAGLPEKEMQQAHKNLDLFAQKKPYHAKK